MELNELTISELSSMIRNRTVSAPELTQHMLDRIAKDCELEPMLYQVRTAWSWRSLCKVEIPRVDTYFESCIPGVRSRALLQTAASSYKVKVL